MRDGIYKDLPLPPAWQRFFKSCSLEAERGKTAEARLLRAVWRDFKSEVATAFLENARKRVDIGSSLLPSFTAFEPDISCVDLGGRNSPYENEILARIRLCESAGAKGSALWSAAISAAAEYYTECRFRQCEQHCLIEGGSSAKATLAAMREALAKLDVGASHPADREWGIGRHPGQSGTN